MRCLQLAALRIRVRCMWRVPMRRVRTLPSCSEPERTASSAPFMPKTTTPRTRNKATGDMPRQHIDLEEHVGRRKEEGTDEHEHQCRLMRYRQQATRLKRRRRARWARRRAGGGDPLAAHVRHHVANTRRVPLDALEVPRLTFHSRPSAALRLRRLASKPPIRPSSPRRSSRWRVRARYHRSAAMASGHPASDEVGRG